MGGQTPEGKVRTKVVKWAADHDIGHVRMSFRPGVKRGVPDDQFMLPNGWSLWIEFKAPGKKPTPKQEEKLTEMKRRHHYCMWTDDPAEAIAALTDMLTWKTKV